MLVYRMEKYVLGAQLFGKIIKLKNKIFSINIMGFPALGPTYGFGSYGRNYASFLCSNPRCKIGSNNRIYAYYKKIGQGPQYIDYLLTSLSRVPHVNQRALGY